MRTQLKYYLWIVILLFVRNTTTLAQTITGKLLDTDSNPVSYANVVLLNKSDSLFLQGTISNELGEFRLEASETRNKLLKISCIGYQTMHTTASLNQPLSLTLLPDNQTLEEVVVTGTRKAFKMQGNGTLVASVNTTVLGTLNTADEVLGQLPFVNKSDNSITIFGKGRPLIYINNRLVREYNELQQLSPKDIKEVKVITAPGAKYDASVKSVIKIVTVTSKGEGFSGNLQAKGVLGRRFSHNEYASFTYRQKKFDIFGSFKYGDERSQEYNDLSQQLTLSGYEKEHLYEVTEKTKSRVMNPTVGFNWLPNPKHSLGVRYRYRNTKSDADILNYIITHGYEEDSDIYQQSDGIFKRDNHTVNAYYEGQLNKELLLAVNTDYVHAESDNDDHAYYLYTDDPDHIYSTAKSRSDLYAIKANIEYDSSWGMFEAGGEYSNTNRKQNYKNGNTDLGLDNTDDRMKQNRAALYLGWQNQWGDFNVGAGLRYEWIHLNYYEKGILKEEQKQRYNKLFPNLSIAYATDKCQASLAYETKVNYPSYGDLRSDIRYNTPFLYESGNPFLKPDIQHSLTGLIAWGGICSL